MNYIDKTLSNKETYTISGLDAVIADVVVPLSGHQAAIETVIEFGKLGAFNSGDKYQISREE